MKNLFKPIISLLVVTAILFSFTISSFAEEAIIISWPWWDYENATDTTYDLLDLNGYYFNKGDMFWIALDDNDRVIGCVGCNLLSDGEAALHRLYVKYNLKRQGIGAKLLTVAEYFARESGRRTMKLHLGDKVTYFESRQFYSKHGYSYTDEDHMIKMLW